MKPKTMAGKIKRPRGRPRKIISNVEPLKKELSELDYEYMRANLAKAVKHLQNVIMTNEKSEKKELYPQQIETAEKIAKVIIEENNPPILLYISMQGGKTGTAAALFRLLKRLVPCLQGSLVCGNDQIDLRAQSKKSLEFLGLKVLSRKDRFHLPETPRPYIVFYDETHFADGEEMSINTFIERHELKKQTNVIFVGISATPFSATGLRTITVPIKTLEQNGYNSVSMMLDKGRVVNAEPLFSPEKDSAIDTKCNIYEAIKREVEAKRPSGYGLIRCRSFEASKLRKHLERRYGNAIYIVDYNMHTRDMDLETYVSSPRTGVFTLILLQQRARMGNVVPTQYVKFMAEFSKSPTIETTAQSLLGRSCGFGKQHHDCKVYTHFLNAQAYQYYSEGRLSEFFGHRRLHNLKISARAHEVVTLKGMVSYVELERLYFHGRTKNESIRERVKQSLAGKGVLHTIRTLSTHAHLSMPDDWHPLDVIGNGLPRILSLHSTVGTISVIIVDDYHPATKLKKDWKGKVAICVLRVSEQKEDPGERRIEPTQASMFYGWGKQP